MKKTTTLLFAIIISISAYSQHDNWWQRNARINLCGSTQAEVFKVAGKFSPAASISVTAVINETYYIGAYMTKKFFRNYEEYGVTVDLENQLDADYHHAGLEFVYMLSLGRRLDKHGLNKKRGFKLSFGLRAGGGQIWMDNKDKEKITPIDYFYSVQPSIGLVYAINSYVQLNGGIYMTSALSIDKLSTYVDGGDFFGPGAFFGVKVSLFKTKRS